MERRKMILMTAALLFGGSGAFTAAEAQSFWQAFGDIRIGGVRFSVGYHSPYSRRHRRYRGRYYRTSHRLKYQEHSCGAYCYRDSGYDYHHQSCPLLGAHLSRYSYDDRYRGRYDDDRYYDDRYYDDDDRSRRRGRGRGRGRRRW